MAKNGQFTYPQICTIFTYTYTRAIYSTYGSSHSTDGFQEDHDGLNLQDVGDEEDAGAVFSSPKPFYQFTPRRPSQRNQKGARQPNPAIENLMNMMAGNPKRYGIDTDGRIKNNQGKPIRSSHFVESLMHLLSPASPGEPSPKGTKTLKIIINKNSEARKIFEEGIAYTKRQKFNYSNISQNAPAGTSKSLTVSRRPKPWAQ
jgi:hypothetical protein